MKRLMALVAGALVPLLAMSAAGQSGPQVVITLSVMGAIQDQGGAYYIAFAVNDSLLAGPQPDSTNWTHYVVYRGGRFLFGTVPPAVTQPFGFIVIRPPVPFLHGQVLPGRRAIRVTVPLADLRLGSALPGRFMVNFVTTDDSNRPLDALGLGSADRFGFVTVTVGRDVYVRVKPPRGEARLDPNFAIAGGEIEIRSP